MASLVFRYWPNNIDIVFKCGIDGAQYTGNIMVYVKSGVHFQQAAGQWQARYVIRW